MQYTKAIQNLIDVIEGCDPAVYGRVKKFRHQGRAFDIEGLADNNNRTRRFVVVPGGSYSLSGAMGQTSEPGEVTESVTVFIAYAQNNNPHELFTVIREDVDLLAHRLRLVSLFDRSNNNLQRRRVVGVDIELEPSAGSTAVLTLNVEHRYRPVF